MRMKLMKMIIYIEDEEYRNKNSKDDEEADDEYSETSSSTDYVHLECKRIRRQHSFAWQHEDRTIEQQTKDLEGKLQKKRFAVPEISSEIPLEHSEIVHSKDSFFVTLMSIPKTNTIPAKN